MKRPADLQAYLSLIDDTLFEAQELVAAAEYDGEEDMGPATQFAPVLIGQLRDWREALVGGEPVIGDSDLPFMSIVRQHHDGLLPFKALLRLINDTHRLGYGA